MNDNSERDPLENYNLEKYRLRDIEHHYANPNKNHDPKQAFLDYLYSNKKDYPGVAEAYDAYMHKPDSSVVLFILAAIESHDLHIFDFSRPDEYKVDLTQNDLADLVYFKENFTKNLNLPKPNSEEAEGIGKELYRILIPHELDDVIREKYDKDDELSAWIYCKNEKLNPIWEWLYITSKTSNNTETLDVVSQKTPDKNSSSPKKKLRLLKWCRNPKNRLSPESPVEKTPKNKEEEGFFWGDRFTIVRVTEKCEFENSRFDINTVADIVINNKCSRYAYNYSLKLGKILSSTVESKRLKLHDLLSSNTNQLHPQVYLGVDVRDIHEGTQLCQLNSIFLFLNVFSSKKTDLTSNHRSKLINRISAKTMMYPSFIIPKSFANTFLISFCNCIITEKNVVKAATKTREIVRQDNDGNLWRLVYIVEGNPFTERSVL